MAGRGRRRRVHRRRHRPGGLRRAGRRGDAAPGRDRPGTGTHRHRVGRRPAHRRPGARRHRDQRTCRRHARPPPAGGAAPGHRTRTRTCDGRLCRRRMARLPRPARRRGAAAARLAGRLPGRADPHPAPGRPSAPHPHRRGAALRFAPHPSAGRARRHHRLPGRRRPRAGGRTRVRCRRPARPGTGRRRVGGRRPRRGRHPGEGVLRARPVREPPGRGRPAAPGRPGVHADRPVPRPARRTDPGRPRGRLPRRAPLQRRAARAHRGGPGPHRRLPRHRPLHGRRGGLHRLPHLDRGHPPGPRGPLPVPQAGTPA